MHYLRRSAKNSSFNAFIAMESTTQPPVQKFNKRNTEETFLRGIINALFVFVPAVEKNPCVNVLSKGHVVLWPKMHLATPRSRPSEQSAAQEHAKQPLDHPQHQLKHQEQKIGFTIILPSVSSLVCCWCS